MTHVTQRPARTSVDLTGRADVNEQLDGSEGSVDRVERTLAQFALVNQLLARYRGILTRQVLCDMARDRSREYLLADLGAGGCDVARWLIRRCRERGLRLAVRAVDRDPRVDRGNCRSRVKPHGRGLAHRLPCTTLHRATQLPTTERKTEMNPYLNEVWSTLCVMAPLVGLAMVARAAAPAPAGAASGGTEPFALAPLPYAPEALEPHISARTMGFHYGKHHQSYVDSLNKLVAGTPWAVDRPLERVIQETVGKADQVAIFNNAAQVWNHAFFWRSMKPGGGGKPTGRLMELLGKSFGSFDEFKKAFVAAGVAQFGSGWVWLVQEGDALKIVKTSNADTPLAHGQTALLTCDVWEHAYYLDYQNRRKDFVQTFLDHLANWEFAASQMD